MHRGIDLGTTNSAIAYIDPREAEEADFPPIHIQHVPQHVRPGAPELPDAHPAVRCQGADPPHSGTYAREQRALHPTRSGDSAKDSLTAPSVPRTSHSAP